MGATRTILSGLNDRQTEAVLATQGPVLVISGPGSGKTKTLAHRVAYLMARGVPGREILAVTFTNKAAGEMRARVAKLLLGDDQNGEDDEIVQSAAKGGLARHKQFHQVPAKPERFIKRNGSSISPFNRPFIGTFHGLAASILREHSAKVGRTRHFTIYDEVDQTQLLKSVMKELNVSPRAYPPGMVRAVISNLKTDLIAPDEYAKRPADEPFGRTVARIYQAYQRRLDLSNALDFDDLMFFAIRLLHDHPAVLGKLGERFQYLHVDEFQDVNPPQYELMKLLAGKHRNIFAIGDDSQSIYSWRQADPRLMFEFEKDFPGTRLIFLEENYRSTPEILEAANHLIRANRDQKEKTLWTKNSPGEPPELAAHPSEAREAEFVSREILRLRAGEGIPWRGFAVLYRTNAQSRAMEEAMIRQDIPYDIVGALRFFERREIKDLTAYLRALVNPKDAQALGRIVNVPPRGIGPKTAYALLSQDRARPGAKEQEKIASFQKLLQELERSMAGAPLSRFLKQLIGRIGYERYLDDGTPHSTARMENVRELVSLARKYDRLDIRTAIARLSEEIALASEQDELEERADRVRLMTAHASKGLEFPVVFVTGLEEGLFPHQKALSGSRAELEEERRLCYVAMTRAQKHLYLTWALDRLFFGERERMIPSRFLRELGPEISKGVKELAAEMGETISVEE